MGLLARLAPAQQKSGIAAFRLSQNLILSAPSIFLVLIVGGQRG